MLWRRLRLLLIDQPGVHVGVDGHLLAGQCVGEVKAGGNWRYGNHGNHQELNRDQSQKEHKADDVIAADNKLPEGLDPYVSRSCNSEP